MTIIIFFVSIWYLSLFSQTFFHHRYASHGAFTMSKGWEKFFFIFTYITQGTHYLSPKAYAVMHRMHHAHADTELDPHSPNYSSNLFSMMLRTHRFYSDIYTGKLVVDPKFTKNVPEWESFDRWAHSWVSRLLWLVAYVVFFVTYATAPWQYIFLPVILVLAAFHGAIINWFAHKFGYRNFKMKNTSENLLFLDVLMLGESYHNNHHKRPSSANFGYKWHEIDPVYPVILLLHKLKVIRITPAQKTPEHELVKLEEESLVEF
jgi:stearoyl-CoA desaturase (delta-9 desaturase)